MLKAPFLRPLFVTLAVVLTVLAVLVLPAYYRGRWCGHFMGCQSNLMQLGGALRMYAEDYAGHYPPQLSNLYPRYATRPSVFLCPIRACRDHLGAQDVLKDFNVCYEYVPGLKVGDDEKLLLAFDREDNHARIPGHHRDSRLALFADMRVRAFQPRISSSAREEWARVWATHRKLLWEGKTSRKSHP